MINDTELEYEQSNIPVVMPDEIKSIKNNFKNIVDLLSNVKLKKPVLSFKNVTVFNKDLLDESIVKISLAPSHGRNANHLYIGINNNYYGKITPRGEYIYSSYNISEPFSEISIKEFLSSVEDNPKQKIIENGKQTGICCCCGRLLTDPVSIANGIGPICVDTWGF